MYPLPMLRLCIALFAVSEGWLLLDIGLFVLFLDSIQLFAVLLRIFSTKSFECNYSTVYLRVCLFLKGIQ